MASLFHYYTIILGKCHYFSAFSEMNFIVFTNDF